MNEISLEKEFGRFGIGGFNPIPLKERIRVFFSSLKEGRFVWRTRERFLIPISPNDSKFENAPYCLALIMSPKASGIKLKLKGRL